MQTKPGRLCFSRKFCSLLSITIVHSNLLRYVFKRSYENYAITVLKTSRIGGEEDIAVTRSHVVQIGFKV